MSSGSGARTGLHDRSHAGSIEPARRRASAASTFRDQSRRPGDLSRAGSTGRLFPARSPPLWPGFASLPALDRGAPGRVAGALEIDATTREASPASGSRNARSPRSASACGIGSRCTVSRSTSAATSRPSSEITPCGIANVTMTSMEKETGAAPALDEIARQASAAGASSSRRNRQMLRQANRLLFSGHVHPTRRQFHRHPRQGAARPRHFRSANWRRNPGSASSDSAAVRAASSIAPRAIASPPALQLDAQALADLAEGKCQPDEIAARRPGAVQYAVSRHAVNAYLVWDPAGKKAVAFDTGARSAPPCSRTAREEWPNDRADSPHARASGSHRRS